MPVLCGSCGQKHPTADDARACSETEMRSPFRRKPQLHPLNQAAYAAHREHAERRQQAEKEAPRDDERNLAGVRAARQALRGPRPAAAAR